MNFLAHAYLSFNHPEILVGNMISDFVKGKKKFDYSKGVQQGINLHRQIDAFTDIHPATKEAKTFLQSAVGLYSGAFVDVAYDHFLANDANEFSDTSLRLHATHTYQILATHNAILPDIFQKMFPYMQSQNWLYNYRSMSGTESSFGGVVRRAAYLQSSVEVFELFQKHYSALQNCYNDFFPSVKAFSFEQIEQLRN
ncbi:acyl carrier protein phosphodiesterase [Segetibacter aerophilus]|uniref:ACP phosphodiesterase n=1 Tax=Segetibacter aerophilus TaxID=670293 RepID=A0A512BBT5_9BACT|nr:ACP phosphodiesterase [Segetibacter aerophilus]GEO09410.1 ACP phosphodiesterase [Segetibacter aerophilus]